ncbi:YibE/F family protein [Paenibacillus rhizophilus]|uniref:YibE/F family protein n=1 Tax=Paenibacillus rhizophilus TaxID=1850366 RepID=A0A3N9P395_9BACL|nr:YibE/F family protein [Paenibacillus rhizophilus]RQW10658.1 YibE/F family protein [Paenibacillus rhizophilus]
MPAFINRNTLLFTTLLLIISIAIYLFNQAPEPKYNDQGTTTSQKYEKAKVLKVISEDLQRDEQRGDLYHGSQELELKILSGEHKGEVLTVTNNVSAYLNVVAKQGQTLIVNIDSANANNYLVTVYSYHRAPILYAMALLFFGLLWWIGGKKGLKSVFGIVFTFACIVYLFIPMLYRGYSPILASVLVVILITCVTLLLLNGWSSKTAAAIVGTGIGVALSGVIAYISGNLLHISGYNTDQVEVLIVVADQTGMQLKGLLFAGILLSSLGAIMDIGISIASTVHEIYLNNPNLSRKELFKSGVNVGRDIMGTMANTLILAFTGSALASLMVLYAVKLPFTQLVNMNMVTIEALLGLTGCFGVVLTVPIVAFISSRIIPNLEHKAVPEKGVAEGSAPVSIVRAAD